MYSAKHYWEVSVGQRNDFFFLFLLLFSIFLSIPFFPPVWFIARMVSLRLIIHSHERIILQIPGNYVMWWSDLRYNLLIYFGLRPWLFSCLLQSELLFTYMCKKASTSHTVWFYFGTSFYYNFFSPFNETLSIFQRVSHSAKVNIYGLPYIREMPKITGISGNDLTVKCPVAGYPIDKIHWERGK